LATTSTPASADTVVDGCTIVSNPTPTNFTNCPNANLAGADLASLNLSYANLAGAQFVFPFLFPPESANLSFANLSYANLAGAQFVNCAHPGVCLSASMQGTNLTKANLSFTTLAECVFLQFFACGAVDLTDAVMPGANLSFANVQDGIMVSADLAGANLTGTNLGGAALGFADLSGTNLTDANLTSTVQPIGLTMYASLNGANVTGTLLVPSDQSVTATSQGGAVATWSTPAGIPGATPGSCKPPSGSTFPVGTTTVTCQVVDHFGEIATGTFTVTVQGAPEQLASLLVTVTNIGPGTSLADKVLAAQAAVAAGLPAQAIADLNALINEVRAQAGKKLTPTQATAIVAAATHVINVLST
jgi:uncharacterized protein YjbI with pentapeptide repeats